MKKQISEGRAGSMTGTEGFSVTVSILTPVRNGAEVVGRAIRSVQAQTMADWEMILVDDGSEDDTVAQILALAADDPRVHLLRHETGAGAAAARNSALAAARGRYVAFLDADDAWAADKLALQLALMAKTGAGLCYTGFTRISGTGAHVVEVPATVTRAQLLRGNVICCSSAMYDRALLGSVPMPDMKLRQDYALWLTLLDRLPQAVGLSQSLVQLHVTPGSLSSNRLRASWATWQMHRGYFGVGPLRAAYYVAAHLYGRLRRG